MATKNEFDGSVEAGSPITNTVPNPNEIGKPSAGGEGETGKKEVSATQYKELESLVGKQGEELGEFRKFFSDIAPILDKLDKSPDLVQAIIDGNVTGDLAKAAIEGKVKIEDAEIVTKAHEEVKKDLGKEAYKGASSEEVSKLVEEKAAEIKKDLDSKLRDRDELTAFESSVSDFVSKTPDFAKYAGDIDKWLDKHDVTDIRVAYYAVKGELSEKEATKQAEIDKAEESKNLALNASGGRGVRTYVKGDQNIVDSLIAGKANPNIF